jgi:putative transposase
MPKKGHTEEQIITALKQCEGGEKTADICRSLGVSHATFYMWKKQYAGLRVQELRELRPPLDEDGWLKRLIADLALDRQEIVSKNHEASPAMPAGEVCTGGISDWGAPLGTIGESAGDDAALKSRKKP